MKKYSQIDGTNSKHMLRQITYQPQLFNELLQRPSKITKFKSDSQERKSRITHVKEKVIICNVSPNFQKDHRQVRFEEDSRHENNFPHHDFGYSKSCNPTPTGSNKYNLNDLFTNTPVFQYPPLKYNDKDVDPWKMLQVSISSPFREDQERLIKYVDTMKELVNTNKREDIVEYIKNVSHKFPFYYVKLKQSQIKAISTAAVQKGMRHHQRRGFIGSNALLRQRFSMRFPLKENKTHYSQNLLEMKHSNSPKVHHRQQQQQQSSFSKFKNQADHNTSKVQLNLQVELLDKEDSSNERLQLRLGRKDFSPQAARYIRTPVLNNQNNSKQSSANNLSDGQINLDFDMLHTQARGSRKQSKTTSNKLSQYRQNHDFNFQQAAYNVQNSRKDSSQQEQLSSHTTTEEPAQRKASYQQTEERENSTIQEEDIPAKNSKPSSSFKIVKPVQQRKRHPSILGSPAKSKYKVNESSTRIQSPMVPFDSQTYQLPKMTGGKKTLQNYIDEFSVAKITPQHPKGKEEKVRQSLQKIGQCKKMITQCRMESQKTLVGILKQSHENSISYDKCYFNLPHTNIDNNSGQTRPETFDKDKYPSSSLKSYINNGSGSQMNLQWRQSSQQSSPFYRKIFESKRFSSLSEFKEDRKLRISASSKLQEIISSSSNLHKS